MIRGACCVVAVVLVLSGCASVDRVPEPGFSAGELNEFLQTRSDAHWAGLRLPDELRPEDRPVTIVSFDLWWQSFRDCMDAEGFGRIGEDPNPYAAEGRLPSLEFRLADYTCSQQVVPDPVEAGVLNRAQSEYAYDYLQQTLIPCLVNRGVTIDWAPSFTEFRDEYSRWNPILYLGPEEYARVMRDTELLEACPPIAPGLPDLGQFG